MPCFNYYKKLEKFAEVATRTKDGSFFDPSNPHTKKKAEQWINNELLFLRRRDREELKQIWKKVCEDPRDCRMFFTAIKVLQNRYIEV